MAWERDAAKGFGRYAYRMGRTASQALADARVQGVPERLLSLVADGWGDERRDTIHGGHIDPDSNPLDPDDVPHTKSLAEVRRLLAGIKKKDRCSDDCPGWAVFDTDRGFEIQTCDECMSALPKHLRLSDDDVAQLPEAQKALREVDAEWMEKNPMRPGGRERRRARQQGRDDEDRQTLLDGMRERGVNSYRDIKELLNISDTSPMPGRYMRLVRGLERDGVIRKREDGFWVVNPNDNPAGRFTAKGERMYEDIKSEYEAKGDARAAEIAARTVYARSADGVPGLLVRGGRPPGVPNRSR